MIYIIADDLTGATDTGGQFAKKGYVTHVAIVPETRSGNLAHVREVPGEVEVLVIDTETRQVDVETARQKLRNVLQHISLCDGDMMYKKVDSTLRGNVGTELDECLKAFHHDVCLFTPSFPHNNRITVDGCLWVDGTLLGDSEYYTGNLDPHEASYIPAVLQLQTDFPIARIELQDVVRGKEVIGEKIREHVQCGKKVLVVDSANEEQLGAILTGSFEFDCSILYAGSAGFANALSDVCKGTSHSKAVMLCACQPVLLVSGSRRSIAQRQIDYLTTQIDLCDIALNVELMLEDRTSYLQKKSTQAIQAIQSGQHTILHPDSLFLQEQISRKLLSCYNLDYWGLGAAIRDALGKLVATILEKTSVNTLIVTGGDTAIGICDMTGMYNVIIQDELLPGIPVSTGRFKNRKEVNIVTKAGGFGDEETLYLLLKKLIQS